MTPMVSLTISPTILMMMRYINAVQEMLRLWQDSQ